MKGKRLLCLLMAALLLSSCSFVTDDGTTAPTISPAAHSLQAYTDWIGKPAQDALKALETDETVEFMGLTFSRALLTEGEFFSGVELTCQLDDAAGQTAETVWNLVRGIHDEYLNSQSSYQNVYSETDIFTMMKKEEYLENLETALEKRGAYIFDISWNISRFQSDETAPLLEQMGQRVLEETKQQFKDSNIDYVWSVKTQLDLTLEVTVWDANRADVRITCKALAEPAGGMDLTIERKSERYQKFFQVSYERLLGEQNLRVLGYGFQTAQNYLSKTWEEIYLHGDDFLYIVESSTSQKIYLQVDGVQYKTTYRNGEYSDWEVLTNPIAHPLPWRDTTMEIGISNNGSVGGYTGNTYQNALDVRLVLNYDEIKAKFWSKANSIYKAEYRTIEELVVSGDYQNTDCRRVLDIAVVTEQEAAAAIEEYKAMLPGK